MRFASWKTAQHTNIAIFIKPFLFLIILNLIIN